MLPSESGNSHGTREGESDRESCTLPWQAGVIFGVGAFFAIRSLLPMVVKDNPFAPIVAAFYVPMSWLMLVVGLIRGKR